MKTTWTLAILVWAAAGAVAQDRDVDPQRAQVLNKLNSMRVTVDFKDQTLDDALGFLRDFSGLNLVVDAEVYAKLPEDQLKVSLKVNDLLLKSTLKLMLHAKELTATYKDGVILIVPKSKVDKAVSLQIYDVRDLLVKIQDFVGPKVELVSPTAGAGPLAGAQFTIDEPKSTITEDFITEMVKANTGDRTWDENPNASITLANGMLIVSQSGRVHDEIKRLVNLLRQFK
jgi:type II secretory pathway component GspD/PulD (secretin)